MLLYQKVVYFLYKKASENRLLNYDIYYSKYRIALNDIFRIKISSQVITNNNWEATGVMGKHLGLS